MTDGKQLETLVAFVEKRMLPEGFTVTSNQRIYDDDGVQIAEFDIEIRGRLGTTDLAWLIECRDRPSSGPAPGSWVEQLVGRRSRFGFNKVTAVSTTGFAAGAQEFAKQQGIELRTVDSLTPGSFNWLQLSHMSFVEQRATLSNVQLIVNKETPTSIRTALQELIASFDGRDKILRSTVDNSNQTAHEAFVGAIQQEGLFRGITPGDPVKDITLHAIYDSDESHYVVDTAAGEVRIEQIIFSGQLAAIEKLVPVINSTKYRNVETGETISQVASFAPHDFGGISMALEFHRMGENGETYIVLRKADDNA